MKGVAKFFCIFDLIKFILAFIASFFLFSINPIVGMILVFYALFGIILCSLLLSKLSHAQRSYELTAYGIIFLLFINFILGIIILCLRDEHLTNNLEGAQTMENNSEKNASDYEKELAIIRKMESLNIKTIEEYKKYCKNNFSKEKENNNQNLQNESESFQEPTFESEEEYQKYLEFIAYRKKY